MHTVQEVVMTLERVAPVKVSEFPSRDNSGDTYVSFYVAKPNAGARGKSAMLCLKKSDEYDLDLDEIESQCRDRYNTSVAK